MEEAEKEKREKDDTAASKGWKIMDYIFIYIKVTKGQKLPLKHVTNISSNKKYYYDYFVLNSLLHEHNTRSSAKTNT